MGIIGTQLVAEEKRHLYLFPRIITGKKHVNIM